jgi:hypothetical protein
LEAARRSACMNNLRQIHVAAVTYHDEYDGNLPRASFYPYGNSASGDQVCFDRYPYSPDGTSPATGTQPTGWHIFIHLTESFPLDLAGCPSMDDPIHIVDADGVYREALSYGYRYNNAELEGFPRAGYHRQVFGDGDKATQALFVEASQYRWKHTGGGPYTPYTESRPRYWQQQWAHRDGGNVATHDGAVQWLPNRWRHSTWVDAWASWPTAINITPYGGGYAIGTQLSIDKYLQGEMP